MLAPGDDPSTLPEPKFVGRSRPKGKVVKLRSNSGATTDNRGPRRVSLGTGLPYTDSSQGSPVARLSGPFFRPRSF